MLLIKTLDRFWWAGLACTGRQGHPGVSVASQVCAEATESLSAQSSASPLGFRSWVPFFLVLGEKPFLCLSFFKMVILMILALRGYREG